MQAPAPLVQRVRAALTLPDRFPLDYYTHAVPQLKRAQAMLVGDEAIDELAARAGNKGAKSYEWAAYVLACMQKRPYLDGVPLPQWRGPVTALALVLDYEQQKLSTQKHVLKLLGKWPHHPRWKGDILASLLVQPIDGNSDRSTWSKLTFQSQVNRRAGLGARADIIWADEPPLQTHWQEARKAGDAGRRGIRLVGFTPLRRREWSWLRDEYGETARGATRRINQDWAECRWSIYDNSKLTRDEIDKQIRQYAKDGLMDSRIFGDYLNDAGACPFDVDVLNELLDLCWDVAPTLWRVSREAEDGEPRESVTVPVHVWEKPRAGREYLITIDPSSGTNKAGYDPLQLDVTEMGSGDLVAEFGGYVPPYSMGVLAAGLARQYHNAVVDVEVMDRWGVNVFKGLHDSRYGNLAKERRELEPGKWANELGFKNTKQTRPIIVGANQTWLADWKAGIRYGKCPSRKHIECLLDCVIDEKGKPVAAPGLHDERMITRGQGLRRAVTRSGRSVPDYREPARPSLEVAESEMIALIQASGDQDGAPFGQTSARVRSRPRM